jgi:cytochrome c5
MKGLARSLTVLIALPLLVGAHCAREPSGGQPGMQASSQGWTQEKKIKWYTTSQGSRLIPRAWFHALEQPDNSQPFLDPPYLSRFRYLPLTEADWSGPDPNPSCPIDRALPIGFPLDCQSDADLHETKLRWKTDQSDKEQWVGMNCSACHTTSMTYSGKTFRFEGGPTLADFQSFTEALELSLQNTLHDKAKFDRFAEGVLGKPVSDQDRALLSDALTRLVAWNSKLAHLNYTPMRYGFGRLDAIGHIFNKVALAALPEDGSDNTSQTANPSDAPVSYPFLWNITQLDKVEWNGISTNKPIGTGTGRDFDYGALGRNTGEVIGVFADIAITRNPGAGGYNSSINEPVLVGIEEQLETLQPPKWPAEFPAINQALAKAGGDLFVSKHCDTCHTVPPKVFSPADKYTTALTKVSDLGTDMWMACNAVFDGAKSGAFENTKLLIVAGNVIGKTSDNLGLVQTGVVGALLGKKGDLVATAFEGVFGINRGIPSSRPFGFAGIDPKEARRNECNYALTHDTGANSAALVYKGRPLQGIWATAPYLHNGSVATLHDLLMPAAQRRPSFFTGTREFDPVEVGYKTDPSAENSFEFDTRDKATGKPIDGNSNAGHDYGNADLSEDDRKALIEYMKTL